MSTNNIYFLAKILYFYQVSLKYSDGYSCYRADKKSNSKARRGKARKPKVSLLYATRHLVLFYISTRYHKNIPKGIRLTERTRNQCIIIVKYNKGR